jgi:hypothetical protein
MRNPSAMMFPSTVPYTNSQSTITMKTFQKGCKYFGFVLLYSSFAGAAYGQVSSKQFEAKALPALDVEERYDFLRQQTEGLPPRPRDPGMYCHADEIEISAGWSIAIPTNASPSLVTASEELQRYAIIQFEGLRLALAKTTVAAEQRDLLQTMTGLLREERERTQSSREAACRDSRLGYEWEQDYIYTPDTIEEKLKLLDDTLNNQIPAYRRRHGL